jgi:hypothetical protein
MLRQVHTLPCEWWPWHSGARPDRMLTACLWCAQTPPPKKNIHCMHVLTAADLALMLRCHSWPNPQLQDRWTDPVFPWAQTPVPPRDH